MALFDVLVTQGASGWNVGAVSSSPAVSGTVVLSVSAADAGTAAKEVAATLGVPVDEAWRVYPVSSEAVEVSPTEAS